MSKRVEFKPGHGILRRKGQDDIHPGNLTWEVYQSLIEENKNYAELFNVVDEEKAEKTTTKKEVKNGNSSKPASDFGKE